MWTSCDLSFCSCQCNLFTKSIKARLHLHSYRSESETSFSYFRWSTLSGNKVKKIKDFRGSNWQVLSFVKIYENVVFFFCLILHFDNHNPVSGG